MKKLITFIFSLVILSFIVSADMPITHKYLDYTAVQTYNGPSTEFYESAVKYPSLVFVGNQLTDLSVAYYYVNKGTKYEITHSPGFCVNMLKNAVGTSGVATQEEEFACAVGSCVHASEDVVSHTIQVPYAIRHTGVPNEIIHVPAEQHRANQIIEKFPEMVGINNLLPVTQEDWEKCIPLVKRTLNGYNEYESDIREGKTDDLINTFIGEVVNSIDNSGGTNYNIAFNEKVTLFGKIGLIPPGFLIIYLSFMIGWLLLSILLLFKKNKGILNYASLVFFFILFLIQAWLFVALLRGNAFQTLIFLVKPISNLVPITSFDTHTETAINNVHLLFERGESFIASIDNPKIASGFEELNKANEDVKIFGYIYIFLIVSALGLLIWANFRKNKSKQRGYIL